MARFKNLGDLIRRDRDLTKVAIIDLGGEEVPTEYTYLELDAMTVSVTSTGSSSSASCGIVTAHATLASRHARALTRSVGT